MLCNINGFIQIIFVDVVIFLTHNFAGIFFIYVSIVLLFDRHFNQLLFWVLFHCTNVLAFIIRLRFKIVVFLSNLVLCTKHLAFKILKIVFNNLDLNLEPEFKDIKNYYIFKKQIKSPCMSIPFINK